MSTAMKWCHVVDRRPSVSLTRPPRRSSWTAPPPPGISRVCASIGRAAVSNWRKRFDGFPEAIGGTAASPTFRLTDVETWLIANGRMPQQSGEDRLWRALQHSSSDPEREIPGMAGALLALHRHGETDSSVNAGVVEIAKEIGPAKALTFLADRFIDLRGRRGPATTSVPVTDLMVELADPVGKTVLDPACRTGRLLAAGGSRRGARAGSGRRRRQRHNRRGQPRCSGCGRRHSPRNAAR